MVIVQPHKDGSTFTVWVQPKSARNQIVGVYEDALKIKLTAPPVGGAANKMCIKFLAKSLKITPSRMSLLAGHTARRKQILVKNEPGEDPPKTAKQLQNRIEGLLKT